MGCGRILLGGWGSLVDVRSLSQARQQLVVNPPRGSWAYRGSIYQVFAEVDAHSSMASFEES